MTPRTTGLATAGVLLTLLAALPAEAGDSLHASCKGSLSIDAGDGKAQTKKIAATFDDARTSEFDKRRFTMRATVDGKVYTGTTLYSLDAVAIDLKAGAAVLFSGTVAFGEEEMTLDGRYLLDKRKPKLTAALTCTPK